MKTTKIILDRPKISSEDIEKKQNLERVLQNAAKSKPGVLKNPWFYGVVGTCSIAAFFLFFPLDSEKGTDVRDQKASSNVSDFRSSKSNEVIAELNTKDQKSTKDTEQEIKVSKTIESASLNMLSAQSTSDQVNPVLSPKKKITSTARKPLKVPNIGGIHSGAIKGSDLFKQNVIESGTSEPIKSFMIGYYNGTTDVLEYVSGNELSEKLKQDIIAYNTGEMIFFTEMYVTDSDGKLVMLTPINLRILPN